MKTKDLATLAVCLIIPVAVGSVSGIATASGLSDWYMALNKPVFNPPNYLFGPVWTTLYILMGISLYMVWKSTHGTARNHALLVFGIQLILNFAWSFIFFYFKKPGWAFAEILLIWISIVIMILLFYRLNKWTAFLQIPYILWVSFASVLNAFIWQLN